MSPPNRAGLSYVWVTVLTVATWEDVSRLAMALPETAESTDHGWSVQGKGFAWERPLRPKDREALGAAAPTGPILCASVPDLGVKDALIADDPAIYFTTPHFNGFRAVLVRLDQIELDELAELLAEAWLARAPKRLAKSYLDTLPG